MSAFAPALGALVLLLLAAPATPHAAAHYDPRPGNSLSYYETVVLNHGTGNYTGYTEHQWINGTELANGTASNGTVTAYYNLTNHWVNNEGYDQVFRSPTKATFYYSATTFLYVHGTDGQPNYTNPHVWFYVNNNLTVGSSFYLLTTEFNVTSRSATTPCPASSSGWVSAIAATGHGAFQRNDSYGKFSATYTWSAEFDPVTGFIVGYQYVEHDSDGAGDGFTWTDDLSVTHTSYALAPAAAPSSSPSSSPHEFLLIAVVAVIVVVVIVVIALALSRRRGPKLPRHSPTGRVDFTPPPMGAPPPAVGLTPRDQPAVQQIVMKETVKVNCRYCGTLIDTTATTCPNCGAPRT